MRRHIIVLAAKDCKLCDRAISIIRRYGVVPEVIYLEEIYRAPKDVLEEFHKCNGVPLIIFYRRPNEKRVLCGFNLEELVELLEWCFS